MLFLDIYFFVVLAMLIAFGFVTAWSRRNRVLRWGVVILTTVLLGSTWFVAYELLSRPKPITKEYLHYYMDSVKLLGFVAYPGEALHIWVENRQVWDTPRAYYKDWDREAERMVRMMQALKKKQQEEGGEIWMKNPFRYEWSLEDEQSFFEHKNPWPAPRPKQPSEEEKDGFSSPKKYEI